MAVTFLTNEDKAILDGQINELSQEIEEIKETAKGETVAKSGVVVTLDLNGGEKITVEGDVVEEVTLVQQSKNFCPNVVSLDYLFPAGVTATANDDGTFTFAGTMTQKGDLYFAHPKDGNVRNKLLPAGKYYFHTDCPFEPGFNVRSWDGEDLATGSVYLVANSNASRPKWFTLDKPAWVSFVLTVNADTACDGTYYFQLERGETATDYEPHMRNEYKINYPATISAIAGENNLFDSQGTTLTAEYTVGGAGNSLTPSMVNELVAEKLKFDPAPYNIPVLYLSGDTSSMNKDNAVELEYVYGDMSGMASVKWQGSSSIAHPKKNYTVKFDQAFEAVDGWGEQSKYCLKANYIDFSHSRNVVSAKLWGQIVAKRSPANATLAACPNYGAVDGFPCCIVLNGKYMGVYAFNVPKDGWMMNMGDSENEAILCADLHVDSTRFKVPATFDGDFEIEYIADETDTEWAKTSLNNLINACIESDGSDLDTTIAAMMDWESAIDYYIFVALIRGNDMIDKNYLLSTYDGTKWFFTAYDIDSTYGLHTMGTKLFSATFSDVEGQQCNMTQIAQINRVFELIKTYKLDEFKARYKQLRQTVMSEDNVAFMFRNFAGQIPKPLLDEDNRVWPTIPNTNVNNVQQIIDWYRIRCAYIDAEVEAL